MNRNISTLLLAVIIMMFTMAGTVLAQFNYDVTNNSSVTINVSMGGLCPGTPPTLWTASKSIIPGQTYTFSVPLPPCTWGISVNGVLYPLGYNGPITPPNPPSWIIVNATSTTVF